jgi:hypothetical protein
MFFCLNSCFVGYSSNEIFTDLRNSNLKTQVIENCEKSGMTVDLYFESETIPFEYEKIGLLEVQGSASEKDSEIIEKLRLASKRKCCDAIIGIKKNYVTRESGIIFSKEPLEPYTAISYFGIAVKKKEKLN